MEPATLFTLLTDMVKFYPIGQLVTASEYPGYQNWKAIATNKIEIVQTGLQHPWQDVIKSFDQNRVFEDDQIDCSYFQFPSFTIRLVLDRSALIEGTRERTFVLDLSLLTRFYTTYIEDRFAVGPRLVLGQHVPGHNYTLLNLSTQHPMFEDLKTKADQVIPVLFEGYQFVSHYQLFKHTIDNIQLYNNIPDELKESNMYDILFSSYHQRAGGPTYKVTV